MTMIAISALNRISGIPKMTKSAKQRRIWKAPVMLNDLMRDADFVDGDVRLLTTPDASEKFPPVARPGAFEKILGRLILPSAPAGARRCGHLTGRAIGRLPLLHTTGTHQSVATKLPVKSKACAAGRPRWESRRPSQPVPFPRAWAAPLLP
jgi:hypothetical protein